MCTPQWRYTMYSQTHFHSTTHELLVVSSGNAKLLFGGEDNPGRVEEKVKKGDVILLPAGVGHRLPEGSDQFEMVGSYPAGADKWDMCYGREGKEWKIESGSLSGLTRILWMGVDLRYRSEYIWECCPTIHFLC